MSILNKINKIDKNHGWSFFGFVLAVPLAAFSIYSAVKIEKPELRLEVLGNEPVLDVREKLSELSVIYQGQDISSSGQSLSVLLVRLANRGTADLLISSYDPKSPLGVNLGSGQLVKVTLTEASNRYLETKTELDWDDNGIIIAPTIIEEGQWLVLKLLALHPIDEQPKITSSGKVAGQVGIPVVTSNIDAVDTSFWRQTLAGSIAIQSVRLVVYFFGFIAVLLALIIPPSIASDQSLKRKRRQYVSRFKRRAKFSFSAADEVVFDAYVSAGKDQVIEFVAIAQDKLKTTIRVKLFLEKTKKNAEGLLDTRDAHHEVHFANNRRNLGMFPLWDISKAIDGGLVEEVDGQWHVAPERLAVAEGFLEYIELIEG